MSEKPPANPFNWLKWAVEWIFKNDKDIGLYIVAMLALFFTAVIGIQAGMTVDSLQPLIWLLGKVAIAAGVLIFLFHTLRDSPVVRFLANLLVVVATVYFLTGVTQLMMGDRWHPPVAKAACLANPFQSSCPLSAGYSTAAVEEALVVEVSEAEEAAPVIAKATRITATGETVSEDLFELEAPTFAPPPENAVFIQFAGQIPGADVSAARNALLAAGWEVPPEERTAVAAGLNEIRYFKSEDEAAALELARRFAEAAPWVTADQVKLRDLSGADYTPTVAHQFEIWTSSQ